MVIKIVIDNYKLYKDLYSDYRDNSYLLSMMLQVMIFIPTLLLDLVISPYHIVRYIKNNYERRKRMSINSKRKGKTGELEFTKFAKEQSGETVRRTAQYNGKELDSKADVVGLPGVHVEVKRVENLNVDKALEQATRDVGENKDNDFPIVAHRKNQKKWKVTMYADDWFILYNLYLESLREVGESKNGKRNSSST